MIRVGIDLEQFVRDTYGSGIQRVLQYLAREWPSGEVAAGFVVPTANGLGVLSAEQAAVVLSVPFQPRESGADLRFLVRDALAEVDAERVREEDLDSAFDTWLLPEVSYLPSVLDRFARLAEAMPTVMIGYDTLPMTEPANYRFKPGSSSNVSSYFRSLASAGSVVCISDYARDEILSRIRRDPARPILVAHPGGDHIAVRAGSPPQRPRFMRLGTLEARKRPVEILHAFSEAVRRGVDAELVFVGGASASDASINEAVRSAVERGEPVRWVEGASDEEVLGLLNESSVLLSIGTEGYGIPVLEAIRVGTPVLYDGIQPAADLMAGRGSRRVAAMVHEDLVAVFEAYADQAALDGLAGELRPETVPAWSDFARQVALAGGPGSG